VYALERRGEATIAIDPNIRAGVCQAFGTNPGICLGVNVSPDFEPDPSRPPQMFFPVGNQDFQSFFLSTAARPPIQSSTCYAGDSPECAGQPINGTFGGFAYCCTAPAPWPTEVPGSVYGEQDTPSIPLTVLPAAHFQPFFGAIEPPDAPALGSLGLVGLSSALAGVGITLAKRRRKDA
jgi:hypothetical protein